jgi:hypothetical protein
MIMHLRKLITADTGGSGGVCRMLGHSADIRRGAIDPRRTDI